VSLGKTTRDAGIAEADLDKLGLWLKLGGLNWMTEKPTTSYIAAKLVDLVAKARVTRADEGSALDRVRER
jgi:hypothetical protein